MCASQLGLAVNLLIDIDHFGILKDTSHDCLATAKTEARDFAVVGDVGEVIGILINLDAALKNDAITQMQLLIEQIAIAWGCHGRDREALVEGVVWVALQTSIFHSVLLMTGARAVQSSGAGYQLRFTGTGDKTNLWSWWQDSNRDATDINDRLANLVADVGDGTLGMVNFKQWGMGSNDTNYRLSHENSSSKTKGTNKNVHF